jgi:RNA polymerase sigma-70 factor (ECF subfamily)
MDDHRTDEEIVKLVQAGDTESFSFLIERYETKIKRYGRKFISSAEDIEDIVQEIFIKTYSNIQSVDTDRKFSSWIYRIAHNEFINLLRKKEKKPLFFFDPDTLFPHPIANEQTDRDVIDDETKKNISNCLGKISSKYREPLVLYYLEEMDYKEISDVMHIPISTVGIRLKRGKELLKSTCNQLNIQHE